MSKPMPLYGKFRDLVAIICDFVSEMSNFGFFIIKRFPKNILLAKRDRSVAKW